MKAVYANMMFKLPDDFNGTYRDALRLAADYGDEMAEANNGNSPNHAKSFGELTEREKQVFDEASAILQARFEAATKEGLQWVNSCWLVDIDYVNSRVTYFDQDGKELLEKLEYNDPIPPSGVTP